MPRGQFQPLDVRHRGTILVIAMIVLFALAALVLTMGRTARSEALTAANARSAAEADAIERGAEQYAMAVLANYGSTLNDLTDSDFAAVPVGTGLFWITRPTYNDVTVSKYGLLDESAKLDLNTASEEQLSLVPGMTADLVTDILAWRGTGSGSSVAGTDNGTTKGGPFETVDEMRLLPNITRDLLYGPPAGGLGTLNVNADWYQQHGLFDYFTVWSKSATAAADGAARVAITQDNEAALKKLLREKIGRDNVVIRPGREDVFQLANDMNMTTEEFTEIEDFVTSNPAQAAPSGLININTAPREMLATIEQLDDGDVDTLLSARTAAVASAPNSLAWVYDTLKAGANGLGDSVTARGSQYSADITAASGNGRAFRHVRIVIDTSASPMKIIYRRDLTDRGWPLDKAVLQGLKQGDYKTSAATGGGIQ